LHPSPPHSSLICLLGTGVNRPRAPSVRRPNSRGRPCWSCIEPTREERKKKKKKKRCPSPPRRLPRGLCVSVTLSLLAFQEQIACQHRRHHAQFRTYGSSSAACDRLTEEPAGVFLPTAPAIAEAERCHCSSSRGYSEINHITSGTTADQPNSLLDDGAFSIDPLSFFLIFSFPRFTALDTAKSPLLFDPFCRC